MKLLRMTTEYISWTRIGIKYATTRLKNKGLGQFELASGSYYRTKKHQIIIEIDTVVEWTYGSISDELMKRILQAENFETKEQLKSVLENLNHHPIGENTKLYTHFWKPYKEVKVCTQKF